MSDETKCMMCGLPIGDWDFVQHDLHADHRNCDLVVAAALAQRDEALATLRRRAARACERPCGCGSGKWPCHVDGDEAAAIALELARESDRKEGSR